MLKNNFVKLVMVTEGMKHQQYIKSSVQPTKYRDKLFSVATKFIKGPLVKAFAAKYPRLYQFLFNRFTLKGFYGLPLTFLVASFAANLLLLNKIVEHVENSSTLLNIDNSVAQFLFRIRISIMADSLYYFSLIGSIKVVIVVAFISLGFFVIKRNFAYIVPSLISLLGTGTTVYLGKNYFHRIRPEDYSFYYEPFYSFPSGHATVAVAFYGLLFYIIIQTTGRYENRFVWMVVGVLFILLLGFSRLYLGVHYLSDVVAGYSLGLLWLLLAISIIEWKLHKKSNP